MTHPLRILENPPTHWVGDGFPVRSIFDYNGAGRELSPFLLMDYAGPHEFPPGTERRGVGAHPHKGFETVTLVYQGELEHRDSTGAGGIIGPGDVQWMTAGRGILHEEFHSPAFTRSGGTLEMVQLWVNLRAADKQAEPRYQGLSANTIPTVSLGQSSGTVRILAGEFRGVTGLARTFSAVDLWDLSISTAGPVRLPTPGGRTAALLVRRGEARFSNNIRAGAGDLAVLTPDGAPLEWEAPADSRFLFLSGEPLNEPIVGHGPFVMNTPAEIEQAFAEFQKGNLGRMSR